MITTFIPIAFPNPKPLPDGFSVLAADVGGTKTDMALFTAKDNRLVLVKEKQYKTKSWNGLAEIVKAFDPQPFPNSFCFAIAGPINNGRATMTNVDGHVDSQELKKDFDLISV